MIATERADVFGAVFSFQPFGLDLPLPVVLLGTITGLTYGLLAVGLVLVFRSNKLINFAHGEVGAFGAAVFGLAVTRWHVPYWVALPLALLLAGGIGAVAEVAVVRRLRNAPRVMSIVATLGVGQCLVLLGVAINPNTSGFLFPSPPGMPEFYFGALRVTRAYSGMLLMAPVIVVALALFISRTRVGVAMRVSAANADVARMSGIFAGRMSSLAWALAGSLSCFTAILVAPTIGFAAASSFGPGLLLRALAAAVIARMTSLPIALAAGVGLGVVEQLLLWNYPQGGLVELVLFGIIVVALVLRRSGDGGRDEEKGSWAAVQALPPLPDAAKEIFAVRNLGRIVGVIALAVAAVLPIFVSNGTATTMVGILAFVIVGLSVGVITGLGGQVSLGQFAIAAIGATVAYQVSIRVGNFGLAFLYAGLGAAAASLLIGIPALRVKGLMLAVTTLGVALVVPAWLLQQPWALGEGVDPGRPTVGDFVFDSGKRYYYFALGVTVVMVLLAANVRRGGFGRLLVAVRDNEDNARAFTVGASRVKLLAFLLAGFIAGIGGAVFGHLQSRLGTTSFPTVNSIDVVVMTVIGGLGTLAGPIVGVLYYIGIPAFIPLDSAGLAATRIGGLLLILYLPSGLTNLARPLRDRIVQALASRAGVDLDDETEPTAGTAQAPIPDAREFATPRRRRPSMPGRPILRAEGLHKRFGGVIAVDGVSFDVHHGETLGLIGPNGAGKTTTFEMLGGFTRPDSGRVIFDGHDVSRLGPESRAQLGLIRSFQDAALFPTMTVTETVQLAMERVAPTSFVKSALGLPGAERAKRAHARELVAFMGLDSYRDKQVQELSTGTRRITELACLVALQPRVLLLDEPSSGIAQRETESLGTLLVDLRVELDATLVIIEHDIPLIMGLADRIVAMDTGSVIAAGAPTDVRNDPKVVDAYLGGSITAVERSGTVSVGDA